ncbi:site-specific integrase, partial [Piscinibacter sp.]|uniref:site-specific integrase n=1 Tax=Piscinibacter sp. TaxID=1903157 RepID=UPI002F4104F6
FPAIVQQFFTEYLVAQRALSPQTVACYRDAIKLFLGFASSRLRKSPACWRRSGTALIRRRDGGFGQAAVRCRFW